MSVCFVFKILDSRNKNFALTIIIIIIKIRERVWHREFCEREKKEVLVININNYTWRNIYIFFECFWFFVVFVVVVVVVFKQQK